MTILVGFLIWVALIVFLGIKLDKLTTGVKSLISDLESRNEKYRLSVINRLKDLL